MKALPRSFVLDSEALSALANGEKRMQAWAEAARRLDAVLYASTATLAEVTDGSARDARVRQAVKAIRLVDVTSDLGYKAGELRAAASARKKPRDLTVDAIVAATADASPRPGIVITSDTEDLQLLLVGTDIRVERI